MGRRQSQGHLSIDRRGDAELRLRRVRPRRYRNLLVRKGRHSSIPGQSLFAGAARVDHGRRIYGSQRVSLEQDAGSENESRVKNVSYLRTGSSYFRFRGPARREKLCNFPIRDSNEPCSATVFHLALSSNLKRGKNAENVLGDAYFHGYFIKVGQSS